jgi:glycerol-3-phosphate dehydrogenase
MSSHANCTGKVSRSHVLAAHEADGGRAFPIYSMVGGKLTTFRAFAEHAADQILKRMGKSRLISTRDRCYPNAEGYPKGEEAQRQWISRVSAASGLAAERVAVLLERYGTAAEALAQRREPEWRQPLATLPTYTVGEIRMIAVSEQVVHLSDLVRRRSVITLLGQSTGPALAELSGIVGEAVGWDEDRRRQEVGLALREAKGRK